MPCIERASRWRGGLGLFWLGAIGLLILLGHGGVACALDIAGSGLSAQTRSGISSLMVDYALAKAQSDPGFVRDRRLQKFAKVAYLLAPDNRPAVLLHAKLKRQQKISSTDTVVDDKTLLDALLKVAGESKTLGQKQDNTDAQIARYLYALGLLVDPHHEDCLFESELLAARFGAIDWDPLLADYTHKLVVEDGYQQAINGLVVMEVNNVKVGEVSKILLTYRARESSNSNEKLEVTFARGVGEQMAVSLEEAVRYCRKYTAGMEYKSGLIEISFEDKYSSKDGGSAGAAYAVLVHAFMEQFDIDEKFAMTGDISVEGKVLKIGGVYAKIRGAHLDGCTRVSIPQDNVEDLIDQIILHGDKLLGQIEIFSVVDIDQAVGVARKDQSDRYLDATRLWEQLTPLLEDDGWKSSQQATQLLDQILGLCPNHVSARLLGEIQNDTMRQHLSLTQSIDHINDIFTRYMTAIRRGEELTFEDITSENSLTHIKEAIEGLKTAESLLDPKAKKPHTGLLKTCQAITRFIRVGMNIQNQEKILDRKVKAIERSKAVLDRYESTLDPSSRSGVAKYNNQVNRVNKSVRSYQKERDQLNARIDAQRKQLKEIERYYNNYTDAVKDLVQDEAILEKLIRGQ